MRVKFSKRIDRNTWKVGDAFTVEIDTLSRERHVVRVFDHVFGGRFNYTSRPHRIWNSAYRDATRQVKRLGSYLERLVGRG
jgi:hypothetical protein